MLHDLVQEGELGGLVLDVGRVKFGGQHAVKAEVGGSIDGEYNIKEESEWRSRKEFVCAVWLGNELGECFSRVM